MQRPDRGHPARPAGRAARSAERPLAGDQGGLPGREAPGKSSGLTEVLAGPEGLGLGMGWEEGVRDGTRGQTAAPVTPHPVPAPRVEVVETVARRLQAEADRALAGAAAPVAVRVTAAAVEWSSGEPGSRRADAEDECLVSAAVVSAAVLLVGADPMAPVWSRTAPIAGNFARGCGRDASWPAGWLEAAARETAVVPGATGPIRVGGPGPCFEAPRGTLVADAFAAGDLLRLAALRSARTGGGAGRGAVVTGLARGCGLLARRAPSRVPTGSWRSASDPPWEDLALEVARRAAWPDDGFVLTRLIPLRGALLGAGHLLRAGVAAARWGPAAIPPPDWWLAHIVAALGDAVGDATGPPVACPPLSIAWRRRSGSR